MSDHKGLNNNFFGKHHTSEVKEKISKYQKGRKKTESWRKQQSERMKGNKFSLGYKHSLEHRVKNSEGHKGEKSYNWKGGLTFIDKKIRGSLEYRLWREAVFGRDKWTCIWCGSQGVYLQADHIKPFARYPELRFAIDNGRTLCKDCHKTTDTFGGKTK
jgi:hypothetical protein